VRLLGINAPEVNHETKPGEILGEQSGALLRHLITGKTVRLKTDREVRDIYGRLLAQVYLRDGSWINRKMVLLGMAHLYTFTPNIRWAPELAIAEKEARAKKLGIWATTRFRVLAASEVKTAQAGQFRLVRGIIHGVSKNGFSFHLGSLSVYISRAYRDYFRNSPAIRNGMTVIVHGRIRLRHQKLTLSLHSATDLEMMGN